MQNSLHLNMNTGTVCSFMGSVLLFFTGPFRGRSSTERKPNILKCPRSFFIEKPGRVWVTSQVELLLRRMLMWQKRCIFHSIFNHCDYDLFDKNACFRKSAILQNSKVHALHVIKYAVLRSFFERAVVSDVCHTYISASFTKVIDCKLASRALDTSWCELVP